MVAVVHGVKAASVVVGNLSLGDVSLPEIKYPVEQDLLQCLGLSGIAATKALDVLLQTGDRLCQFSGLIRFLLLAVFLRRLSASFELPPFIDAVDNGRSCRAAGHSHQHGGQDFSDIHTLVPLSTVSWFGLALRR